VLAAILGIILYIIFDLNKVLDKVLNTGLVVIKQNNSKIQGTLDNFSDTTFGNLLANNKLKTTVGNYVITMGNNLINDGDFDVATIAMSGRVLKDPSISAEIGSIIETVLNPSTMVSTAADIARSLTPTKATPSVSPAAEAAK